jgi:hypothetical protein
MVSPAPSLRWASKVAADAKATLSFALKVATDASPPAPDVSIETGNSENLDIMDDGRLARWREAIHDRLAPRRHSALLAAIVAAFAVRPLIGGGGVGYIAFSTVLMVLLLLALYNINVDELQSEREYLPSHITRRRIIGWTLIAAAFAERIAIVYYGRNHTVDLIGSIAWLCLFSFFTFSMLRSVLKQKAVTSETISASISVYLLLGFTWGFLYVIIALVQPGAFNIAGLAAPIPGHSSDPQPMFPILGYFSLITLSTVGYGDITPMTLQARFLAAAEGIAGQFYLAILVARLVSMQMNASSAQSSNPGPNPDPQDSSRKD